MLFFLFERNCELQFDVNLLRKMFLGFTVLGLILAYEVVEAIIRERSLVNVMMFRFSKNLILKIFLIICWVRNVSNVTIN